MSNWWESYPLSAQQGVAAKNVAAPDNAQIKDADSAVVEANRLAAAASDFSSRNARTATGGWLAIPGAATVAKSLGIGGPDLTAMDRDAMTMANSMKPAGSRLTQMEFGKYLGGVPNLQTEGPKNAPNAQAIFNTRTAATAYDSYMRTFLQVHGSLTGAQAGWAKFQAQHFGPDGTFYHDPSANPAVQPVQADPRARANAALKARSAGAGGPVLLGMEQ